MAHVILGLLMIRSMSQYDVLKEFERTISLFYSASSGSIRRALDLLAARGAIEVAAVEGARGRTVWAVTEAGRREFQEWMLQAPPTGSERELLARIYFLGLVTPRERSRVLEQVSAATAAVRRRLHELEGATRDLEVPDGLADVAHYQRATLALGVSQAERALDWVTALGPDGAGVRPTR